MTLLTDTDRAVVAKWVAEAPPLQQWQVDAIARVLDNIPAREADAS